MGRDRVPRPAVHKVVPGATFICERSPGGHHVVVTGQRERSDECPPGSRDRVSDDFDTCWERSRRVVIELRGRGADARWLRVAGLVADAPDADYWWAAVPPVARIHYVVADGDAVIDVAPHQFWPDAPSPLVERHYTDRWAAVHDITDMLGL